MTSGSQGSTSSPFLAIPAGDWVAANELAFAVRDAYPVSRGHTLVITRRVVPTWFEATREEQAALLLLVETVKAQLDEELAPQGYNVGFNAGLAAGQTVMHLHVHVIPRYTGDMPDPRGGVRHVIPERGNYLAVPAERRLSQGGASDPFLAHLRPLFRGAQEISILAAFAQESGLDCLDSLLSDALARGARVRVLTGDYLHITQERALRRLLDLAASTADAEAEDPSRLAGTLEARIVETARLCPPSRSFHPKSWRFEAPKLGVAFVGSSNLSAAALTHGIEWNLRLERAQDPRAWAELVQAFDGWWSGALPLNEDWLANYRERALAPNAPLPLGEEDAEALGPPPDPHQVQVEALTALAQTRLAGHQRALVVMATGLGKTYLAAFDIARLRSERGAQRVLFLAHQAQILRQAARAFRRVLPDDRFGWFQGVQAELDGQVVFASIQKLSRPEHLDQLQPQAFDYVVIDEVHHAAAPSYRRVLERIRPRFLLGLTATPDRADEADVLTLFDDNTPFRADLGRGIAEQHLVPFHYHGLRDTTDYAPIPWRNQRFEPAALAEAVQTQARMDRLWEAWQRHPGLRTLIFCCSIAHASFVRDWLRERGVHLEAIHTGEGALDRDEGLARLNRLELDALCAVDLFNEGIDLPAVDRVVMLRPTESPVIFLQQLGRGLRLSPGTGKQSLIVIDFVGNHRVFLDRVRTLLALGERPTSLHAFLERQETPDLPPGCALDVELEAIDLLRSLLPRSDANELVRVYRELRASRGTRPTAGELFRMGYNPRSLRQRGGWLALVGEEGDLKPAEQAAYTSGRKWFEELEITSMNKSFKMITLQALIDAERLVVGMPVSELAERSQSILMRQPELRRDVEGVQELSRPARSSQARWLAYWRKNPIKHWCDGRWFTVDQDDRFVPRFPALDAAAAAAFADLTSELVDLRLAQYRRRQREDELGGAFETKLVWNKRDPILKLPSRKERPDLPEDETDVRLPDGGVWRFRFMTQFCNVARPVGTQKNRLPDLLRGWFGPSAGRPGTDFRARFSPSPDGWWVEPLGASTAGLLGSALLAYPSLEAAAGSSAAPLASPTASEPVRLPGTFDPQRHAAVRAAGDSMDGGPSPIRSGDWLVLEWRRAISLSALSGRVALVAREAPAGGPVHLLKRVVPAGSGFELRSDNPDYPSLEATSSDVPLAVVARVVAPESLAPAIGTLLAPDELAARFKLERAPASPIERVDGHLFFLLEEPSALAAPDRLTLEPPDPRPAETAFLLTRSGPDGRWRYAGVARQEGRGVWAFPALDLETWRDWAKGSGSSRTLSRKWSEAAQRAVTGILSRAKNEPWIEARGKRCRVLGPSPKGGVRIDGGDGGFKARTVSALDLGFALEARELAAGSGGAWDEALVNRVRYLEGTKRDATRWIDTSWALALLDGLAEGERSGRLDSPGG